MVEDLPAKNKPKSPKGLAKLGVTALAAAAAVGFLGRITDVGTPKARPLHVMLARNSVTLSEQKILAAAFEAKINATNRLTHGQPIHFLGGLADIVIARDHQEIADYQIANPLTVVQNGVSLIGYIDYENSSQDKPDVQFVDANDVVGWSEYTNDPKSIQAGKQYAVAFDSESPAGGFDLNQPVRPDGQPLTSPGGVPMSIGYKYGVAASDGSAAAI